MRRGVCFLGMKLIFFGNDVLEKEEKAYFTKCSYLDKVVEVTHFKRLSILDHFLVPIPRSL